MRVSIPHLSRRRSTWYFRLAVPHDLRPRLRQRELKKSLCACDLQQATVVCNALSSSFAHMFEALRMSPQPSDIPDEVADTQ